ncbi:chorismate mutase [Streptomyces sp. NPDC087425]|uniref:chorismate mutase n=1 Tax=Streptomyces sp. NPDC087425 TaxID=3365787 RepID=UPI003816A536
MYTTPTRRLLTALAATAAVVLPATGTAVAAPTPHPVTAAPARALLHPVADLSAQRLATADLVAAAKFGTDSPIDDPAREAQVLDAVAAQAKELGTDPDAVRAVFRDQIEANKLVQRTLFQRWTDHPEQAPTTRPDLAVIRVEINRITTALVQSLADTAPDRATALCRPARALATVRVIHERRLDHLHTEALARSLNSVC